jgi:extracellular factor (EF) 3-hydroxypalmitic acid methyl ester biosynthesis protein
MEEWKSMDRENVEQETFKISANLARGKESIPIRAQYASKYSIFIRFLNHERFLDGAEFNKLFIKNNGEEFELGPCRFISEPNIDGYDGRLIFVYDVYDLRSLFSDNRVLSLQNAFIDLPLVLAHKEKVKQSFKDYTANLSYDLNVYKSLFDDLDTEYIQEPSDIQASVQEAIINTEGRSFLRFLDEKLDELKHLVAGFSKEEHERHGFYFRKLLWSIIMCSPFMKRTNLKPRGYPGDSVMMRMLYRNEFEGETTFARLMHKHPMEHPAAKAVRNRRKLVTQKLIETQNGRPAPSGEKLKVLSVACGPAFEMQDILLSSEDCDKYHFTLLDQDRQALYEAATLIGQIEKKLDTKIYVDYLNESVRTMLASTPLREKWGRFDYIYSMGLFDYLTPPVASAVLGKLYEILRPGGTMLIGNFHVSNPSRCYMEYWLDWVLYYRTEEEFADLLLNAESEEATVFFEDSGSQMFLQVEKT